MANETTTQIVREAQPIEDLKIALMQGAQSLQMPTLPAYQVAGMTKAQTDALAAGQTGIGSYLPYMQAGAGALKAGTSTLGEAANVLRGADTRNQFSAAQQAYNQAAQPAAAMGNLANVAGAGMGYLSGAGKDIDYAQQMAQQYAQGNLAPAQQLMMQSVGQAQGAGPNFGAAQQMIGAGATAAQRAAQQPGFQQGIQTLGAGALQGQMATQQPGFGQAQGALGMGIGALQGAAQGYNPQSAQAFMNPYQQQVIDESVRQINRQGDIERQNLQAQAVRAGAFGGSREGIQRAELERGLSATRNAAIINALQQGYGQAQQQSQTAFEQQQQRQLAQAQGLQGAAGVAGSLAGQQAGLGLQAAGLTQNVGQAQLAAAGQQGQLGLQAASQLGQAGQQFGSLEAQRAAQALQAAQYGGNIGQQLAAQQLQQAQLGQGAANLYGQLAGQQAGLAGQYAGVAGQQASILGQQSQLQQALGQGIGNLAAQQFGIGQNMAQGLGSLGTQIGNLGVQQAALGQTAQQLGQQDVNFLYNLGAQQQKQSQAELDALRATKMQQAMQPYQQLAFVSDIYKGAPSTQMAVTQQAQAAPSPFQQIAGLGIAGLGAAGAAAKAGIL
jgi:hypothetical protein